MEPKILFIQCLPPDVIGYGGTHRSYQILHDLQEAVGEENVLIYKPEIIFPWSKPNQNGQSRKSQLSTKVGQRFRLAINYLRVLGSPYRLLPCLLSQVMSSQPFGIVSAEAYLNFLDKQPRPDLCIFEHPSLGSLLEINLLYKIPTIYCPQNIESLEMAESNIQTEWNRYVMGWNLTRELDILAKCDERLFISKTETGLISGLGYSAIFYPYLSVGAIRHRMRDIHFARSSQVEQGLLLVVGTASHKSTGKSFRWFVQQVKERGLPQSIQVIFVGAGTDTLLPPGEEVPGLDMRGWVNQDELDQLMKRAQAILIPQQTGFGASTRLAEISCAEIPAIVSQHATLSVNMPPGVYPVQDDWNDWRDQIERIVNQTPELHSLDYENWERQQDKSLGQIVKKYLN